MLPFFNDSKKSRTPGAGRESLQKTVPLKFVTDPLRSGHRWFHSHNRTRNHFVATMAEFIGTTLFLFFAFAGTQVAKLATPPNNTNIVGTPSDPSQLLYIALSFGFSLAVNAWVFFRISGGLFNPAVRNLPLHIFARLMKHFLICHRSLWACVLSVLSHTFGVFFCL